MGVAVLAATAAAPAPNTIGITDYMFGPESLTVAVGTKVTWVNHDEVPHTVVDSDGGKLIHSAALDTDDTFSFTFTKPGTYHYFCTLHPQMVGTVVVK